MSTELAALNGTHMIRYEAMCTAIAECHRVDEAKEIREKAKALEAYYQQARNTEAERKACDIRLRAERRSGELLAELARATPQTARQIGEDIASPHDMRSGPTEYAATLKRLQMTPQQANRFERLAAVPEEIFEQALADPIKKPAASRIVKEALAPSPRLDRSAMRLWGDLRQFERERIAEIDISAALLRMTDTQLADCRRLAPAMAAFWAAFEEHLHT